MASDSTTLAEKIGTLPDALRREVEQFVESLLAQQRRAEQEQQAVARGWPPGYFEQTAGSLPDFPEVDDDSGGIDPSLDRGDVDLRLDAAQTDEPPHTAP